LSPMHPIPPSLSHSGSHMRNKILLSHTSYLHVRPAPEEEEEARVIRELLLLLLLPPPLGEDKEYDEADCSLVVEVGEA